MVKSLHALGTSTRIKCIFIFVLGEPHLEICPKNIWVEDQFLVYLRPFKLKFDNQGAISWRKPEHSHDHSLKFGNNSKYWYMAPEQILRDPNQPLNFVHELGNNLGVRPERLPGNFASDMWSIGCVFAEMFVSLTPVFQAIDNFDRALRFFEVEFY